MTVIEGEGRDDYPSHYARILGFYDPVMEAD